MIVHLALTSFGLYILNERSEVISAQLTYPHVEISADNLSSINKGVTTEPIREAIEKIGTLDTDSIVVDHGMFAKCLENLTTKTVRVDEKSKVIKWFRDTEVDYLQRSGAIESSEVVNPFRQHVALLVSKETLTSASEEKDILVKNAIDAVGEIDKSINVLAMRLREWYSLHYPSLDTIIEDHEIYTKVITTCKSKSGISAEGLRKAGLSDKMTEEVLNHLLSDIGAELAEMDLEIIGTLAERILSLYDMRKSLEAYIEKMMSSIAPNITTLVGHMVGARLISLAGSLKDLARKPSSTVQVFGAEKALFRSLKTGAAPPKHGVIYQVPEIHSAAYWQRGKIARALAGKLSIAARIDAYSKHDIGKKLREDFEQRVEDIKKQNPVEPPPKPKEVAKPPTQTRQRKSGRDKRRKKR